MSRRGNIRSDEQLILQETDPQYVDPDDVEAQAENGLRTKLANRDNMFEEIEDELYGSRQEAGAVGGYLQPASLKQRGGYISARGADGGWIHLPLMALASFLPSLFGSGKGGSGKTNLVHLSRHPNLSSPSSFYRDVIGQGLEAGVDPAHMHAVMGKLFGSMPAYRKMMSGKSGGASPDQLLMGHLLNGPLQEHLKRALKGTGIDHNAIMDEIEQTCGHILDKPVDPAVMARGGSLLGSLWGGIKNIFGKIIPIVKKVASNERVQKIAKSALDKVGDVAESQAPEMAELASNRVASYLKNKLKGDEPSVSKKKKRPSLEEEEEEEEEESPPPRRAVAKKLPRLPAPPRRDEEDELPSGQSDSGLRKKIVQQRQSVPDQDGRKVIGYREDGSPAYGNGKKKTKGGAWTVRLEHAE